MKIDKFIKLNKGRSFDLPFFVRQDKTNLEFLYKVVFKDTKKRSIVRNYRNVETLPIELKEEMP